MRGEHTIGDPVELAADYCSGGMTREQVDAYEHHLSDGCDSCAAALSQLEPVVQSLFESVEPVEVDAALRQQVLDQVGKEKDSSHQIWKSWGSDDASGLSINMAADAKWESLGIDGINIRRLFVDRARNQMTAMVRMAPGTAYPSHTHDGPEECLVLEGDLRHGDQVYREGDYHRMGEGSHHGIQSTENGCLLLIVSSLTDEVD